MGRPEYHECFDVALTPLTLERLQPALEKLADDEFESDTVRVELSNLANDIRARLQRISRGDKQRG